MPYLTLEIFFWKLPIEQSSTDENVVMGNNETICMNDEIMEENANINKEQSIKWERRINEDKSLKNTCIKKNLATTWKIIFVLEFLLCQW
jgi:hypothetical protein